MIKLFKSILKAISIVVAFILGTTTAVATKPNKYDENHFNVQVATLFGGQSEVRLHHNRRADIITKVYAIETDWLPKAWSEGVGQSLAYAELSNKKPGIVVLIDINKRVNKDQLALVNLMAKRLNIRLWFFNCDRQTGEMTKRDMRFKL